jgi:glutathione S-transferase
MTDPANNAAQGPVFGVLAQYLKDLSFESPRAPDIFLATLGSFAGFLKLDVSDLPALAALTAQVMAMPAIAAAMAREKAQG